MCVIGVSHPGKSEDRKLGPWHRTAVHSRAWERLACVNCADSLNPQETMLPTATRPRARVRFVFARQDGEPWSIPDWAECILPAETFTQLGRRSVPPENFPMNSGASRNDCATRCRMPIHSWVKD
jgi:hypothetical protein